MARNDYTTTKTQVRRDFAHARYLMRLVSKMMSDKTITDYSNDTEFGQIVNELVACASSITVWQEEQLAKLNENKYAKESK